MDSTIELISETLTQDDYGAWESTTARRQVFCRVGSIDDAEFYEAGRTGLNPSVRVTMFHGDYNGESLCVFESDEYSIYRTRRISNSDYIDLYLERKGGRNGQADND